MLPDYRQAFIYAQKSMAIKTTARDELECRCLVCRCLYELGQATPAKQEIEQIMASRDANGIDPAGMEDYAACMEIYRGIAEAGQ